MAGLVPPARPKPLRRGEGPAIDVFPVARCQDVDARDKPGHDELYHVVAARKPGLLYGGLICSQRLRIMSVDAATVRRIAHLARIAVDEAEIPHLQGELNAILAFVEQLSEVNVDGVEPMTSVTPMEMKKRPDVVNDGGIADEVIANAPASEDHFFLVPKVVE
jgi:aspartyl-tRNA(Asn)/glutamyl-tRNA(Gln) amidotransferase subunit C